MLFVVDFPSTTLNPTLQGCFPSSLVAKVVIFFSARYPNNLASILSFRRLCDVALFTHHLELWGSCSFLSYPFNRSVVFSFEFSHLIKFCLLPQPGVLSEIFLTPCAIFFNSSGGSVLLISSSNIPSSQVHVLFLPCSTGVLPEFFPSHLVLTGVVSNSILSIKLLIHVFATFKFS